MVKFLDLKKQYLSIKSEIDSIIFEIIDNTAFIGGKYVSEFEKNFASFQNVNECIGVANGTDALEIAIWALDLPKDSEIIVPANSFIATSEAVSRNGLKVVFADVNEDYLISTKSIRDVITPNTKAIIPVHLYGQPADMDEVLAIAKEFNLRVIEDCAQAHGSIYKGKKVGAFGDIATFSFYPGKNLGAYGDAGGICTNNKELAEKMRLYANNGSKVKYHHELEGINSRLDTIQAGVLNVKLKYLQSWIDRRNQVAKAYLDGITNPLITLPILNKDVTSAWHLFVIRVDERDRLSKYLTDNEIQNAMHYPIALPKLEAYSYITQDTKNFFACNSDIHLLSLPMGEHLEDSEVNKVIDVINSFKI
jgi:dTDP-4-amino-4,6-dideoxygalactose transaminase